MDWLKDKKNQPIVITIFAVIIVGVAVAFYFMNFAGSGSSGTAATPPATDPSAATPGVDPATGMAVDPNAAATTDPNAAGTTQTAVAKAPEGGASPMEAYRTDPFLPPGYKPPKNPKGPKPKPRIPDLPLFNISRPPQPDETGIELDKPQPARRMAGLVLNNRIFAIIETNGTCETVQPGDMLKDRLAVVDRIENDRIVLKTTDRVPKYLVVRMASAPRTNDQSSVTNSGRPDRGGGRRNFAPVPGGPMDMPMPGPEPM